MDFFPLIMVAIGAVFLGRAAFIICHLLRRTTFYKFYWGCYLLFILFFFISYIACLVMAIIKPDFLNYFFATVLLLGGVYVFISSYLSFNTIFKIEVAEKLHIEYENLRYHSEHDALTGCNSRSYFFKMLESRFKQIKLEGGNVVLLFIDLDKFKAVNDNFGHNMGDNTLHTVGTALLQRFRSDDIVARFGGDEFVVLMEKISLSDAKKIAEEVADSITETVKQHVSKTVDVGCSIGITLMTSQNESVKQALDIADQACYKAKRCPETKVQVL